MSEEETSPTFFGHEAEVGEDGRIVMFLNDIPTSVFFDVFEWEKMIDILRFARNEYALYFGSDKGYKINISTLFDTHKCSLGLRIDRCHVLRALVHKGDIFISSDKKWLIFGDIGIELINRDESAFEKALSEAVERLDEGLKRLSL